MTLTVLLKSLDQLQKRKSDGANHLRLSDQTWTLHTIQGRREGRRQDGEEGRSGG